MMRRRQRGAIGLSAVLLLLSVLLLAAVAIDTARLFFAQRELQTQADLAALAMSRSCYIDGVAARAAAEAAANASLTANGFDASSGEASFTFGEADIVDSHWRVASGGQYQPAGRVSLTSRQPASLMAGGLWGGEVELGAAAAVYKRMAVGFGLGSGLLEADVPLANTVLGALLEGEVNLSLVSYEGLANTSLSLGSLLAAAGANALLATDLSVGTVDEVLDSEVALADLLQASIDALDAEGTADADVRAALVELQAAVPAGQTVTLSDFLTLATASGETMEDEMQRAALATHLDLYGLATGAIYAANRNNAVAIEGLSIAAGAVGLDLTVVEPPQYTFGLLPASADDEYIAKVETAQVRMDVIAKPLMLQGILESLLSGLLGGVLKGDDIGIQVDVARAEASLRDANGCGFGDGEDLSLEFDVKPSVANLRIGDPDTPSAEGIYTEPVELEVLDSLPLLPPLITISIGGESNVSEPGADSYVVEVPPGELPYKEENIGGGSSLGDTVTDLSSALAIEVNGISSDTVTEAVLSLVGDIVGDVVEPLLKSLGITVGYADVIVVSVEFDGSGLIE